MQRKTFCLLKTNFSIDDGYKSRGDVSARDLNRT